jgi:serine protease inhibitor
MKYLRLICLAGIVLGAVLIISNRYREEDAEDTAPLVPVTNDAKAVAAGYNEFGFRVLHLAAKGRDAENENNLVFSPLSLATALAFTQNGAAGSTKRELRQALGNTALSDQEFNTANLNLQDALRGADPKIRLQIANSLWIKDGFPVKSTFMDAGRQYFKAQTETLNSSPQQSVKRINDWVQEKTGGNIKSIIDPPLAPELMVALLNAVYFKGKWADEFKASNTRDGIFYLLNGKASTVPYMSKEDNVLYWKTPTVQAVRLPYGNDRLSMWIILPQRKNGVNRLIEQFNSKTWNQWTQNAKPATGTVKIPRFKIETTQKLIPLLRPQGIELAFQRNADFSALSANRPLWISDARQKAYIEVDEKGTEAAAVSAVQMTNSAPAMLNEPSFIFIADHPFLAAIEDSESGSVLFLCIVRRP